MKHHGMMVGMKDEDEKFEDSPGRQKMSDDVTVGSNPNYENYGGDKPDAASFDDADGIKVGLSRRSPMDYIAKDRDSLGVNSKSRGKYNGSN